jgi:polyisoprenoid-binding protein YceI
MRRLAPCVLTAVFTCLLFSGAFSPAAAQEWKVNKARSRITLALTVDGQPVEGRFSYYKPDIAIDPEDASGGKLAIAIDASSLQTGAPGFDAMLAGPEWLNAGAYPAIRLASVSIKEREAPSYRMEADLTVRGVTKRITVPLTIEDEGVDGSLRTEIRINPRAFNVGPASAGTEEMQITINLTATHLTN